MPTLLDTGFLVAVLADNDPRHELCVEVLRREPHVLLIDVVLAETAYLILRDMTHQALARRRPA